ncbi:MAG TPA: TetR/AcrR family transcriptional regulator [Candidatus Dormibacteraeota bacterium]|nr:TetR/AcrR family transcriptional regulator [Candidatus Dormibacteraeota bacterium]
MAYEVVKRVRGRAYRYRVEAFRDPVTGRSRGRWTYLGRIEDGQTLPPEPPSPGETRERLLAAVEHLLERTDHRRLTAGGVAREAGLAHGTFYRYFTDKDDALVQALERLKENAARLRAADVRDPLGTLAQERERLRRRCEEMLRGRAERRGLVRTWFALSATDPRVARMRRERRQQSVSEWAEYLDRLRVHGYVAFAASCAHLADALVTMLEGCVRRATSDDEGLGEPEIAAIAELVERAIFGGADSVT